MSGPEPVLDIAPRVSAQLPMLQIDFTFSDAWNGTIDYSRAGEWDEIDVRYGAALGNLILVVNGVDGSALWGWIPIVDLAVSLDDIREQLANRVAGSEVFELTESDATITFERAGDDVRLTTSSAPCSEMISFEELKGAISEFRGKVFREAVSRFPELEHNAVFRSLRSRH